MTEIKLNAKSRIPIVHEADKNVVIGVLLTKSLVNIEYGKTVCELYHSKDILILNTVYRNI